MIEYSFVTNIRIDWSDIDLLGHVNNIAIMRYMQTATVLYFESIGLSPNNKELEIRPIMASVSGQFKKQLYYPGNIRVLTMIHELKTTSIHLKHYVINEMKEIAAEGINILVMFDFNKNIKCQIPSEIRLRIQKAESLKLNLEKN